MSDLAIRILVLLAAVVQIIVPRFINPFGDGKNPLRSVVEPSQIEPAGYAFAIWGPIYLLALGYAVWQLSPAGRADPMTSRIAPLAIALYVGSSLWLAVAQYGPIWATMPILAMMAACACAILVAVVRAPERSPRRLWLMIVPFALYAGWTVCATFVNIAEVAPAYGFKRFGLTTAAYAVVSIAGATILASVVLWLCRGQLAFAVTIVWALVGIIVAALQRGASPAVVAAAASAIIALALLTAWLNNRGRALARP